MYLLEAHTLVHSSLECFDMPSIREVLTINIQVADQETYSPEAKHLISVVV